MTESVTIQGARPAGAAAISRQPSNLNTAYKYACKSRMIYIATTLRNPSIKLTKMVSRVVLLALAVAAAVVAPPVLATEFVVADDNGWKNNNFDYKAWAESKEFHVGDKLSMFLVLWLICMDKYLN